MTPRSLIGAACIVSGLLGSFTPAQAQQNPSVYTWLDNITREVRRARALAASNHVADARSAILLAYLDAYEPLEGYYGPGGKYGVATVAPQVHAGEVAFHALLQSSDAGAVIANADAVDKQLLQIREAIRTSGVTTKPETDVVAYAPLTIADPATARTREVREILLQMQRADAAYRSGDDARALALVEHLYLERFEPMESRLPARLVDRIEKTIHLQLRPAIKQHADAGRITALLGGMSRDMFTADQFLAKGGHTWFAVVNSFVIVVREGLEAVLLIAALLTYLGAIGADARHRRQIFAGVATGLAATIATWFIASTLIPISGANRELIEGVTALLSVAVLLYVAHWLFQKTYIHDWKDYLRNRVGGAVTRGSAFAMAMLAFAAVYREGFETVLFYQALAFDSGMGAILMGFIPGAIVIIAFGFAIIRAGVKLPLKKVFAGTNAVLMYLAFVFIGKGLYNLQEAGLYSPHPLPLPDHPALRQLLGFYPLVETLAAQAAFILLLMATYLVYRSRMLQPAAAASQEEPRARVVA